MNNKIFLELEKAISNSRLTTYQNFLNTSSNEELIKSYILNAKLSENFYFLLQNLDDDLKETLILLHSNYVTELEVIKKVNYKALDQLVSNNIEAYHFINEKDDQLSKLVESLNNKKPKLSVPRTKF